MISRLRTATLVAAFAFAIYAGFGFEPGEDLKNGWRAYRIGDIDQSMRLARRAGFWSFDQKIKERALALQARAAIKSKRLNKAVNYLTALLRLDPENYWALVTRADIYLTQDKFHAALTDLKKGVPLAATGQNRTSGNIFLAKALALRGLARLGTLHDEPNPNSDAFKEAEKDALASLAVSDSCPETHLLLSKIYLATANPRKALNACQKAYKLAVQKDRYFFLTAKGSKWTRQLVLLRAINKVKFDAPLY